LASLTAWSTITCSDHSWIDQSTEKEEDSTFAKKYMIQEIIERALKLFYNANTGRYIYYYVDDAGEEWAVFIRNYKKDLYELRTAYRVDCEPPYKCEVDKEDYFTIIDKWLCEKFVQISIY
jgi:hypothetical protein